MSEFREKYPIGLELVISGAINLRRCTSNEQYGSIKNYVTYCLRRVGKNFLPLNRAYQPIGCFDVADYDDYKHLYIPRSLANEAELIDDEYIYYGSMFPDESEKNREHYYERVFKIFPDPDLKATEDFIHALCKKK